MSRRSFSHNKERGFTLLEFLVALTIFATVSVALASTLRSGLKTWRAVEHETGIQQEARVALGRLAQDLRQAVSFPGESFAGESESLTFYTLAQDNSENTSTPVIVRVTYHCGAPTVDSIQNQKGGSTVSRLVLQRQWAKFSESFGSNNPQTSDLTSTESRINFEYAYAADLPQNPLKWMTRWQGKKSWPRAVRVTLFISDPGLSSQSTRYSRTIQIPTGVLQPWKT